MYGPELEFVPSLAVSLEESPFVDHVLHDAFWRSAVPSWIGQIELDGNDRALTYVGTAPAGAIDRELEARVKVRVLQGAGAGVCC